MIFHRHITRSGYMMVSVAMLTVIAGSFSEEVYSQIARFAARDPGVRTGSVPADPKLPGLTPSEQKAFGIGLEAFLEVASVQGTIRDTEAGLGPRFNLDSCAGCHTHPDIGGTSLAINPQVEMAKKESANNEVPSFIKKDGPVREARFKHNPDGTADGGVHALFTITRRNDALGCSLNQPDFRTAVARQNVVFRIPTPLFGAGLIEAIDDDTILANMQAQCDETVAGDWRSPQPHEWSAQYQRERWHRHPLWVESPEQVARNILRRSLQRRAGSNERALPARAG